jgi:transcriptional regulator with XRE-family HTH domain
MTSRALQLTIEGRTAARSGRGKQIRQAAGLSRAEVARLAGVSPAAVSRWESHDRTPRGDTAAAYARALRKVKEQLARG